ncbi:DNA primase small subunit-like [Tubulanus polymorphus]|uniref:DNA primase small subunit-like n=1 Tax=Tubulanus polymorphus TaxID=672921 RepID=UPI003DA3FA3A
MNKSKYDAESLPDLLPLYYKRLFPYGPYFKWLSYGGVQKTVFTHREFSFTLKDDVYIRYQSFSDQNELEKEIQRRCPYKIDIGAIFTHRPKDNKTVKAAAFQAKEKELVFDIDMTDYDDVRSCCQGADICLKCWPLMTIAIRIVDTALREDFGYEHLLWIYSGRRGVHCWVCDEGARKLSQSVRSAIAEYLSVVKGGDNQIKKVKLNRDNVHPSIQRAIKIIEKQFDDYAAVKQDFLSSDEKVKKVLSIIDDDEISSNVWKVKEFENASSKGRWAIIKSALEVEIAEKNRMELRNRRDEVMLQYAYPRLDVNVSKGVNHLLKSPFCIHPKTGRICIPIDLKSLESFDPFSVPTISQVIDEMNDTEKTDVGQKKVRDYKKTSMAASMLVFDQFMQNLEKTWQGKHIELSDMKGEF